MEQWHADLVARLESVDVGKLEALLPEQVGDTRHTRHTQRSLYLSLSPSLPLSLSPYISLSPYLPISLCVCMGVWVYGCMGVCGWVGVYRSEQVMQGPNAALRLSLSLCVWVGG
jgi:hypothetical protein